MKRTGASLAFLLALAACSSSGDGERQEPYFQPVAAPGGSTADPQQPGAGNGNVSGNGGGSTSEQMPGGLSPMPSASSTGMDPLPPGVEPPVAAPTQPLPRSLPEAEGVDSAGVLALVNALNTQIHEVHSLMLVRHGKVVAEGWWAPYAPQDVHVTYSVTKSFNGTAVGFAVQEGLLSVDDLLLSHFPMEAPAQPNANLQAMRVKDLLTMSTGHASDTINRLRQRTDGQWTRAFLELPVENPPGAPFVYNSGAAYMLGSLVQKVTGMGVLDYLTPRLFEPLGIVNPIWGKSAEGVNLGDGGLSVRTEDLAKFGQLFLQKGMWNGQQILSEAWVAAATSSQVPNGAAGYGYQFWRNPSDGFRADGSLGQFSFVLPDHDAVLAITSATEDLNGVMNLVWQHLLPALTPAALPENAAAQAQLKSALAALALPLPTGTASSPRSSEVSGRRYAIPPNSQGIQSVQLDFAGATPVLTVQDADGAHAIAVGLDQWVRGRTGFRKRINELFETPEQGIAARGAWSNADTFVAKLTFDETPYTETLSLRFQGEQVFMDATYNVRWGNDYEPQLVGTR